MCLNAIVTICDASNILRQLTEEREEGAVNEAQDQIAYADIILCNKAGPLSTPVPGVKALGLQASLTLH